MVQPRGTSHLAGASSRCEAHSSVAVGCVGFVLHQRRRATFRQRDLCGHMQKEYMLHEARHITPSRWRRQSLPGFFALPSATGPARQLLRLTCA